MDKNKDTCSILIVDDEPEILKIIKLYLEKDNRIFFEANDGLEALNILEKENIDLVITDLYMPNMDGTQLCREIKERQYNVVTVVLTAYGGKDEVLQTIELGIFDFLEKPLSFEIAENRIGNAIEYVKLLKSEINLLTILSKALNVGKDMDFHKISVTKRIEYLNMLARVATTKMLRE